MTGVTLRSPSDEEQHKLRRLGEGVQIATLSSADGELLEVATEPREVHRARRAVRGRRDLRESPEGSTTTRSRKYFNRKELTMSSTLTAQ